MLILAARLLVCSWHLSGLEIHLIFSEYCYLLSKSFTAFLVFPLYSLVFLFPCLLSLTLFLHTLLFLGYLQILCTQMCVLFILCWHIVYTSIYTPSFPKVAVYSEHACPYLECCPCFICFVSAFFSNPPSISSITFLTSLLLSIFLILWYSINFFMSILYIIF